jgi:hypothetical protein
MYLSSTTVIIDTASISQFTCVTTSFVDGATTYNFETWDVISGSGSFSYSGNSIFVTPSGNLTLEIDFYEASSPPPVTLPSLSVNWIWQYLFEGDFVGFINAMLITSLNSLSIAMGIIAMLFLVPLYIRTQSLMLLCIVWLLLGVFLIVLMPEVSGLAVVFMALGISGLFWRLLRPSP